MSDTDTSTTETEATEAEVEEQEPTDSAESQEDEGADEPDWMESFDAKKAKERIEKIQRHNKNLIARTKAAEEKAAQVDDKDKRITDLETTALRYEVAFDLGLPKQIAMRLQGSTREEMLTDAESLVELVAPTKKPGTRRPAEDLRGGGAPNEEPEETDVSKLGDRMFRR